MSKDAIEFQLFGQPPSTEPKSMLETFLKLQGVKNVTFGPAHHDGPEEFAEAEAAAHDVTECLPELHDTVLLTTGKSLDDAALLSLLDALPEDIKEQIDELGLADTEVREQIAAHLAKSPA